VATGALGAHRARNDDGVGRNSGADSMWPALLRLSVSGLWLASSVGLAWTQQDLAPLESVGCKAAEATKRDSTADLGAPE